MDLTLREKNRLGQMIFVASGLERRDADRSSRG